MLAQSHHTYSVCRLHNNRFVYTRSVSSSHLLCPAVPAPDGFHPGRGRCFWPAAGLHSLTDWPHSPSWAPAASGSCSGGSCPNRTTARGVRETFSDFLIQSINMFKKYLAITVVAQRDKVHSQKARAAGWSGRSVECTRRQQDSHSGSWQTCQVGEHPV